MVNVDKYINEIKNEDLKLYFKLEYYELFQRQLPMGKKFIEKFDNDLKQIFPKSYNTLISKLNEEHVLYKSLLIDTILLEHGYYSYTDLNTLKNIPKGDFGGHRTNYATWKYYAKGLEVNAFTMQDVFKFLDENPIFFKFLMPLILDKGKIEDFKVLNEMIKQAKLEDNIRGTIFVEIFKSSNILCIKYFINEIKENNYFRFKALKEIASYTSGYESQLDIKECINIFEDAINYNYEKYLKSDYQHNAYFLSRLKQFNIDKYHEYSILALKSNNRKAIMASLAKNMYRKDDYFFETLLKDILNIELELEYFCYMPDINPKYITSDLASDLFNKFLPYFDMMDKVNYHYKMDNDIIYARDISKSKMIRNLVILAIKSNDKSLIEKLDERRPKFNEETLAYYLENTKGYSKLNIRSEALTFLKTDNYEALKFYSKQNINLTLDEAIIVSDYLKSKKESIKKNIYNEFMKSDKKHEIAEYLVSTDIEYKVSIGNDMNEKLGVKKLEIVKPVDKIEEVLKTKVKIPKLEELSYKSCLKYFLKLEQFIKENKDYEYNPIYHDGLVTFGTVFSPISFGDNIDSYPLGRKLYEYLSDTLDDIEYVYLANDLYNMSRPEKEYNKVFNMDLKKASYLKEKSKSLAMVITRSILPYIIKEKNIEDKVLYYLLACLEKDNTYGKHNLYIYHDNFSLFSLCLKCSSDHLLDIIKYLICYCLKYDRVPPVGWEAIIKIIDKNLLDDEIMRYFILKMKKLREITCEEPSIYINNPDFKYLRFKEFITNTINEALEVEFNRGTTDTIYTNFIFSANEYYGLDTYIKAIYALRKLTLVRGNYFYGTEKNVVISKILKKTVKIETDTYDKFLLLVKKYNITKEELIKASIYNQEYIDYVDKYLNINYYKSAVYYFMAHLNEELDETKQEKIKEYSVIDYIDFKEGAFDQDWYEEMISNIDSKDFKLIYDNAKYITVAGLHKRAQRFFEARNNQITKEECITKINDTRNKDYVLIYSLIPLENDIDLYERYMYLQEYLKMSKKFGSQRQASERRVVDIALDNLARNAGYNDTAIFIYEMEVSNQSNKLQELLIDDIKIIPYINHLKISLAVYKNDKKIASIPAKLNKNKEVIELKEQIKLDQNKLKRIVKSFEEAMCNKTMFSYDTLIKISKDYIINNVLSKLIFISNNTPLIFKDDNLYDLNLNQVKPDLIYIAHPITLKDNNVLNECINYVIKNNIKQPFKQVLREFYTKSSQELTQEDCWRFRGFNVDIKKCIAALKGKNWSISEEIGLRRVHYYSNTISVLFKEFDLPYTYDLDNYNQELHTISFINRKTYEQILIKDVDDIVYSETLRDVDLMISISSNSIYDYELALSTTEIRQEILKSLVEILNLNNVGFLKDNIKVEGKYGNYLINIRTGLVFKEGKGNLFLKTIYSTNKPILLDFIDEDPMTSDIISKAIVLANDDKIKDSTILEQIM